MSTALNVNDDVLRCHSPDFIYKSPHIWPPQTRTPLETQIKMYYEEGLNTKQNVLRSSVGQLQPHINGVNTTSATDTFNLLLNLLDFTGMGSKKKETALNLNLTGNAQCNCSTYLFHCGHDFGSLWLRWKHSGSLPVKCNSTGSDDALDVSIPTFGRRFQPQACKAFAWLSGFSAPKIAGNTRMYTGGWCQLACTVACTD